MGGACCGGSLTPEEYLREVFSTKCLIMWEVEKLLLRLLNLEVLG